MSNTLAPAPINHVMEGSAKVWSNFNGTGTVAVQDSLNLSSITDNSAGTYTQNFANALSTDNHAATMYANYDAGWGNTCFEEARTTTTHRGVVVNNQVAGAGSDDASEVCFIAFGDLA